MRIFRIGEAVQARWRGRGGQFYPGTVTTVHADHRYDVSYDDGDRETRVEARYLRPLSADVEAALNQERTFEVDERVLAVLGHVVLGVLLLRHDRLGAH